MTLHGSWLVGAVGGGCVAVAHEAGPPANADGPAPVCRCGPGGDSVWLSPPGTGQRRPTQLETVHFHTFQNTPFWFGL